MLFCLSYCLSGFLFCSWMWGISKKLFQLLLSCWGFSALGHWVSPHRCSSVTQPPDDQYRYQTDDILCSQIWRSSIQSAKTRLEADCDSDHELLVAKFRLKLKKVGKTTRPFRYDLNQIPYNYAAEVISRFKGLDLIESLKNYGQRFMTLYRRW